MSGLDQPAILKTANGFGWTSTIANQITFAACAEISRIGGEPLVLDVGAGLGVGTFALLEAGAQVIVNDISERHLKCVLDEARVRGYASKVQTVAGRFPYLNFSKIQLIHSSNVLHFLSPSEIEQGAQRMLEWLQPEGMVFIQVGTVYAGHVKRLLPIFEERCKSGIDWAGQPTDAKSVVAPAYRDATPDYMNYLYDEPLVRTFERFGFVTVNAWYYTRTGLPDDMKSDGREHFGYIGKKPTR